MLDRAVTWVVGVAFGCWCALPAAAVHLNVSNTSEVVNGDTSSPAALLAAPGPDGISLWEALEAANNTAAADSVGFDGALAGSVLVPTTPLPSIWQPLSLTGDTDGDGTPDIVLDGSASASTEALMVFSSDVTITGFEIRDFSQAGIKAFTWEGGGPVALADLRLERNVFRQTGTAVHIYNWGSGHQFDAVTIHGNTFIQNPTAIALEAALGWDQTGSRLTGVRITENVITGDFSSHGLSLRAAGDARSTYNLVSGVEIAHNTIADYTNIAFAVTVGQQADTTHNTIEHLSVHSNQISGAGLYIVGGEGTSSSHNLLAESEFVGNTITGAGINLEAAEGIGASFNTMTGLLIGWNEFVDCPANALRVSSGAGGASQNTIGQLIFTDNLVRTCDVGILLRGPEAPSPNNLITEVDIRNSTIVASGNLVWGGAVHLDSKHPSNQITAVRLTSSILWGNSFGDAITGSVSPAAVDHSILGDVRFLGMGTTNSYLDPQFVDPPQADYRLQSGSPAIDEGDPAGTAVGAMDLWGNQRRWDGDGNGSVIVDVGAHEYGAPNDLTVSSEVVDSLESFAGCHSVSLGGAFDVEAGGTANVYSNGPLALANGVSVAAGGGFGVYRPDAARCQAP